MGLGESGTGLHNSGLSLPVFGQHGAEGSALPPTLPPSMGLGESGTGLHNSGMSLPVFGQHGAEGSALPPTLPPGMGLGDSGTGLHNSGLNDQAQAVYNQLGQQILHLQEELARLRLRTGVEHVSIAQPVDLGMGLGASGDDVYRQYNNQAPQSQVIYNQFLQLQHRQQQLQQQRHQQQLQQQHRLQQLQQQHFQQQLQQHHHQQQLQQQQQQHQQQQPQNERYQPQLQQRSSQTQSPLAQAVDTPTTTEQGVPTGFAAGGNLTNRRWRSPPSTGRPQRIYRPAPSSTDNQDILHEPRASVHNMSSAPVRATSAAVVHPIRQPRGPPPLEELLAKPTSKHEGSKNFAARRRRPQISGLVSTDVARTTSGNMAAAASVSGFVSTGAARTTSGNTAAAASVSGFVSTGVARTTSGNTAAAASVSGFVSTGFARTTSGNTAAAASVSGFVSTGVARTTSGNTAAAASVSGFVSIGVARTTSGNTSTSTSGTTAPISEHEGLVSADTENTEWSAANRNGR
jgi:hypothetical protein